MTTIPEIVDALSKKRSPQTPDILPQGALYLQPTAERRRSGSHYTPRALTQPIVAKTLEPIFQQLGDKPTPEQILDLKICDPAMGSGAFLVEACRQLADKLVAAWEREKPPHPLTPSPTGGEGGQEAETEPLALTPTPTPAPLSLDGRGAGGEGEDRWEISEALRVRMVEIARQLRQRETPSEAILWQALRGKRLDGYKFRRQQPIGSFVVDFFCAAKRLIVEVDGGVHDTQQDLDRERQTLLESLGLHFVRVSDVEVEQNLPAVLAKIRSVLSGNPPHPLAPSPTSGEGGQEAETEPVALTPTPAPAPLSLDGRGAGGEGAEPLLIARRLVAQRCLYGVDKNPFAVNLAKLSLWLATLAQDLPFTFLDHALKCGDSLVGLRKADIGSFSHDPLTDLPLMSLLQKNLDEARAYRYTIQSEDSRTDEDDVRKRQALDEVEKTLDRSRLIADVAIMASYEGGSKTELKQRREGYSALVRQWQLNPQAEEVGIISHRLREEIRVKPFNWEIEFPEVFDRDNGGFDSIVGNPPFAGKNTIADANAQGYPEWLKMSYSESHGNSDLVAYFFRRTFELLRKNGTLGLIATNTITEGDTRYTGLRWICTNGGTIYNAQKRLKWAGLAAVVVSVANIIKGDYQSQKILNNKPVDFISAFFFPKGGHENPANLKANKDKSFQGSIVLGMGFTFDDSKPDKATSIAEMHCLIAKDPRNQERIFPYVGGDEVNSSPTHSHHRYVINFAEMTDKEAIEYPDLMTIIEDKVRGTRGKHSTAPWWQFERLRIELFEAIEPLDQVLVTNAQASTHHSLIFYRTDVVFANSLNIFPFERYSDFVVLQSSIHEIWARFFSSSMKDDLRYNPSDCFETFPFPPNWETNPELETIGKTYYEYRAQLMVQNNQGLTDTYNRFHDPDEDNPDILKLRQLHAEMDKAVLTAYGWDDINPTCEFLLDYEEEESIEEGTRSRKKPYRYRWTEDTHDEVLTRLLALNKERHEAEEMLGGEKAVGKKAGAKKTKKKAASKSDKPQAIISSKQLSLIPPDAEQLEL